MKCFFRSFDVGTGDCNIIRFVGDDFQYSIFVDCGSYNKAVKGYVEEVLYNHINILVVTHIDNDHISGIAKMLQENKHLQIDQIWYNAYRRKAKVELKSLTDEQIRIIERLRTKLPLEMDALTGKREISEKQGVDVAKCILENEQWNAAWRLKSITTEENPIELPHGLGRVIFLSPSCEGIEVVDAIFKDAFNKYFMQAWKDGLRNSESLYEILLRLCETVEKGIIKIPISASYTPLMDIKYIKDVAKIEEKDKSKTNYASIAFILECGEHRIAMLGDAHDDVIVEQIRKKYVATPILCDAVKISHHGSNGNNSKDLCECISTRMYFIPGGRSDEYPTWGTIGRIAINGANPNTKQIIFSHQNKITKSMVELDENLQKELNINMLITDKEYELFEW